MTCIEDGNYGQTQSALNQLQGGSNYGDGSSPLFSMYSKIAEEEDNKMAGRWQSDAKGILIFVSPHVGIHSPTSITETL